MAEPVDTHDDPGLVVEQGQAVECGLRIVLERLTPRERAAYILREAFDYAYRDIANVLRLADANARQVVTRARQHIANGPTAATSSVEQRRLLEAFIAATRNGDVAGLADLLASDTVSTSDDWVRVA